LKPGVNIIASLAVIIDDQQRILITQRPLDIPYGGYWEFPGGKLEFGESPEAALIREVREEVGLQVHQYLLLGDVNHQYQDKMVKLIIFLVDQFSGRAWQLMMKWVCYTELNPALFPDANLEVIEIIKNYLSKHNYMHLEMLV
jgi:8-oxo-dGTP diphosphatase